MMKWGKMSEEIPGKPQPVVLVCVAVVVVDVDAPRAEGPKGDREKEAC